MHYGTHALSPSDIVTASILAKGCSKLLYALERSTFVFLVLSVRAEKKIEFSSFSSRQGFSV